MFEPYLSDRFLFVLENGKSSPHTKVSHGVTSCSVLGSLFFTLYPLPYSKIIRKPCAYFHCCADDTQLYLSIKLDDTNQLGEIWAWLKDINTWNSWNFFLLNSTKLKLLYLTLNIFETCFLIRYLILMELFWPPATLWEIF